MKVFSVDPEIMHGAPCFAGTRVPIEILFEYMATTGLNEFLLAYPHITRHQVDELLRQLPIILQRLPQAQSIAS